MDRAFLDYRDPCWTGEVSDYRDSNVMPNIFTVNDDNRKKTNKSFNRGARVISPDISSEIRLPSRND